MGEVKKQIANLSVSTSTHRAQRAIRLAMRPEHLPHTATTQHNMTSIPKIYGKRVRSSVRLTAGDPLLRIEIGKWLVEMVAPAYRHLLPSRGKARTNALQNLEALDINELLYMVAMLQEETHYLSQYPLEAEPYVPEYFRHPTPVHMAMKNWLPPFVALVPSRQPGAGLGIVCTSMDKIPANTNIGLYQGGIVTIKKGRNLAAARDNPYILLVIDDPDHTTSADFAIDAMDRTRSTWTRFLNEARGNVCPNTRFQWSQDHVVHIVTTRSISPGEELLIHYN